MSGLSDFNKFLADVGPLAARDRNRALEAAKEEAPEFRALSFFESGEVVATKILAYLLTPSAPHGQGDWFLRKFLEVLEVDLSNSRIGSPTVQTNAPCYTLGTEERSGYRLMDILIQFRADGVDYVVVIESKSHYAGDQENQIRDYLRHIRKAFPRSKKFLFYLKDGKPPGTISIPQVDWEGAKTERICQAKPYREVMSSWISECEKCKPAKLKSFLGDFADFLNLGEHKSMSNDDETNARIKSIVSARASGPESSSPELDAVLRVFETHDRIPLWAIESCFERVSELFKVHFPRWTAEVKHDDAYVEMRLLKPEWGRKVWIYLGSEDEARPCHLDLVIQKDGNFTPAVHAQFNPNNCLHLGPGKNTYWRCPKPLGVENLRTEKGVRALLTEQGAVHIVTDIERLIRDYETTIDSFFPE